MHIVRCAPPEDYFDRVSSAMETMVLGDLTNLVRLLHQIVAVTRWSDKTTAAFCCMVVAEMRLMEADEINFDADKLKRFRDFAADIAARTAALHDTA